MNSFADPVDEAAALQQQMIDNALANRKLPAPPSPVCRNGDCGEKSQPGNQLLLVRVPGRCRKVGTGRTAKEIGMSIKWDGKGLPPVGCECEIYDCEAWNPVIIKYIGEKYVTTHRPDLDSEIVYCVAQRPEKFRPIRTEAEHRREETAQQMCNLFGNGIEINEKEGYGTAWLDVYDAIAAGKIPGLRLTDDSGS